MNKKGLFLTFLIAIFFIPSIVLGLDTNVLDGVDLSSPGNEITLTIKVNAESTIDKYDAALTYESTILEFISIENVNGWKGNNMLSASPVSLSFTRENGISGSIEVAKIKFKIKNGVTKNQTILSIEGTDRIQEDATINTIEKQEKTIAIKSTDNSLKDLKVNGKTVINFSPTTYSYTMQVEGTTTTANIDATLNDKTATFIDKFGERAVPLEYGENIIDVKIKSASGSEKTYEIKIIRLDNRQTNNDLKEIILNSGMIKFQFNKDVLEYKIKTYKLKDIEVEVKTMSNKATYKINKPKELVIGNNEITIVVTSENGVEKTYKILIDNVDYDIDTSLKNIEIYGIDNDFKFNPEVQDYEIIYKAKYKDNIVIKPTKNCDDESVKIDTDLFDRTSQSIGIDSVVQIKVMDESQPNKIFTMYTIKFVKDNRINFFLILGLFIFTSLLVVFIVLLVNTSKTKDKIKVRNKDKEKKKELDIQLDKQAELEKTKKIKKL